MNRTLFALLALAATSLQADPAFLVVNMGAVGGVLSEGHALNASHVVAGVKSATSPNPTQAGIWESGTGVTGLGALPSGTYSWAHGINANGEVVGGSYAVYGTRPYYWTQSTGMKEIVAFGGFSGEATDINNSSKVVGYRDLSGAPGHHAFLWTDSLSGGSHVDLGTLGGLSSQALGINDSDVVVGSSQLSSGLWHAFRWTAGGGMVDLESGSTKSSAAHEVNAAGVAVGFVKDGSNAKKAAMWAANGTRTDLTSLSTLDTEARSINASGMVVGYSKYSWGSRATLWMNNTIYDLNSLIPSGSGWSLEDAWDISDDNWITGTGFNYNTGQRAAFLLQPVLTTVPEPGFHLALLAGLSLLAAAGRKLKR